MPDDRPASAPVPVSVTLPTILLRLFPGSVRRLELPAATVAEMIDALDRRWPGMRDRLCDSRPRIRRHINVFAPASAPPSRRRSRPAASDHHDRDQRRLTAPREAASDDRLNAVDEIVKLFAVLPAGRMRTPISLASPIWKSLGNLPLPTPAVAPPKC